MRAAWVYTGNGAPAVAPQIAGNFYFDASTGALWAAVSTGAGLQWVQLLPLTPASTSPTPGAGAAELCTVLRFQIAAGGAADVPLGTVDREFEVVGSNFLVESGVAASSCQLRTAGGGGGVPVTGEFDSSLEGRLAEAPVVGGLQSLFPGATPLVFNRSDAAVEGVFHLFVRLV